MIDRRTALIGAIAAVDPSLAPDVSQIANPVSQIVYAQAISRAMRFPLARPHVEEIVRMDLEATAGANRG